MKLSAAESKFLLDLGIPPEWVFDAKGMPPRIYRDIMRASGQILAAGVTPCNAAGHRLRTDSDSFGFSLWFDPCILAHYTRLLCVHAVTSMSITHWHVGQREGSTRSGSGIA